MEYIVHIGLQKTGSTSLQAAFHDNREALRRNGVAYPLFGSTGASTQHHHKSLLDVLSGIAPRRAFLPDNWAECFHSETAGADFCVVSCEGFSFLPDPEVAASLFPRNRTRVLMYVREPVAYIASVYKQRVKTTNMAMRLREFAETYRLPYLDVAEKWGRVFGRENVVIRQIDREADHPDIVADFANLLGLELDHAFPSRKYELNPGIAGNLLFVKRILNFFITSEDCFINRNGFHIDLGTETRNLTNLHHSFCGKIPVDQETVDLIASRSRQDLETLERRFNLSVSSRGKPVEASPCPDRERLADDFSLILAGARKKKGNLAPLLERVAEMFAKRATLPNP